MTQASTKIPLESQHQWLLIGVNLEEPIGDLAQHGLIHTCMQIRDSAENGTGPTDLVDYSLNHESA